MTAVTTKTTAFRTAIKLSVIVLFTAAELNFDISQTFEPTEPTEVTEVKENLEKIQHYFRTLSQILNDLNSLGPWGKQGKDVLRNHDLHKYV